MLPMLHIIDLVTLFYGPHSYLITVLSILLFSFFVCHEQKTFQSELNIHLLKLSETFGQSAIFPKVVCP